MRIQNKLTQKGSKVLELLEVVFKDGYFCVLKDSRQLFCCSSRSIAVIVGSALECAVFDSGMDFDSYLNEESNFKQSEWTLSAFG